MEVEKKDMDLYAGVAFIPLVLSLKLIFRNITGGLIQMVLNKLFTTIFFFDILSNFKYSYYTAAD